jgi:hypothetical protein
LLRAFAQRASALMIKSTTHFPGQLSPVLCLLPTVLA